MRSDLYGYIPALLALTPSPNPLRSLLDVDTKSSNFYVVGKGGSSTILSSLAEDADGQKSKPSSKAQVRFCESIHTSVRTEPYYDTKPQSLMYAFSSQSPLDQRILFAVWANGAVHPVIKEGEASKNARALSLRISTNWTVTMDPAPYQIVHTTELSKVHLVFRMLKLHQAFVTNNGR